LSGTKQASSQIKTIQKRAKRITSLIQNYNDLIPELPATVGRPTPLDKKNFNNIKVDDQLWELDMFESKEEWAFNSEVRKAISALDLMDRCREEVRITMGEAENYMKWATDRMDGIDNMLKEVPWDSRVGVYLRTAGGKTADSLLRMASMAKLNLKWAVLRDGSSHEKNLKGSSHPPGDILIDVRVVHHREKSAQQVEVVQFSVCRIFYFCLVRPLGVR
jgi:hypothetical protein